MSQLYCDILSELSSPVDLARNIQTRLPKILEIIKNDSQSSYFLQVLTTILGPVLNELDIGSYEVQVLRHVLPLIRITFENCIDEVTNTLENTDSYDEEISITLSKHLQVCLDVLDGYKELIENILAKNSVDAKCIFSLHKTIFPVLIKAFSHCKDSENNYGTYFSESTTILTAFFKKSYEVKSKYYKALEDKIQFCTSDDGLKLLNEVLEFLCSIADIIIRLDIKSSVDSWRPYGKLANKYSNQLKNRICLEKPLKIMGENIEQVIILVSNMQISDDKGRSRYLKIGSFILKVVIKLCEVYKQYLTNCGPHLLELLLLLYSISLDEIYEIKPKNYSMFSAINTCLNITGKYLNKIFPIFLNGSKDYKLDESISNDIERYMAVGASPLLSQLMEDQSFYDAVDKRKSNIDMLDEKQCLSLFFLTLSLMKIKLNSTEVSKVIWSKSSLVDFLMDLYEKFGAEIDINTKFENDLIYTKIIEITSSYIINFYNKETYPDLELYLIKKLFSSQIHLSILISDLLCSICRLNHQLCLDKLRYFCNIMTCWSVNKRCRPEYIIIGLTMGRLYSLLPRKTKIILTSEYPVEDNVLIWSWLGRTDMIQIGHNLKSIFTNISTFKTIQNVDQLVNMMNLHFRLKNYDGLKNREIFGSLVLCLDCCFEKCSCDNYSSNWCDIFLSSVLRFTSGLIMSIDHFGDLSKNVLEILNALKKFMSNDINCKIGIAYFLKKLSKLKVPRDQYEYSICDTISSLLIELLKDKDLFVEQTGLETFSAFAHFSPHEEIVKTVLNHNNILQEKLTCYLQKITTKCSLNQGEVVRLIKTSFIHKCIKDIEISPPPCKKLKKDTTELYEALQRIQKDIQIVKDLSTQVDINEDIKILLNTNLNELKHVNSVVNK